MSDDEILAGIMRKIILAEPYSEQSIIIWLGNDSVLIDGSCRITPEESAAIQAVRPDYEW